MGTTRRSGRRVWVIVAAVIVALGASGLAQKVVGPEEFDRAMKTIGSAFDGVHEEVASGAYVEAKAPLALSRQVLASTRPVWETLGEAEAVQMNREAVAALDALDAALSAITVDPAAVAAAVDDAMRACDACHATYREGDEQTGYRSRVAIK